MNLPLLKYLFTKAEYFNYRVQYIFKPSWLPSYLVNAAELAMLICRPDGGVLPTKPIPMAALALGHLKKYYDFLLSND